MRFLNTELGTATAERNSDNIGEKFIKRFHDREYRSQEGKIKVHTQTRESVQDTKGNEHCLNLLNKQGLDEAP